MKKTSRQIHVVREAADKNSSNVKTQSFMARDVVRDDKSSSTKRRTAMGH